MAKLSVRSGAAPRGLECYGKMQEEIGLIGLKRANVSSWRQVDHRSLSGAGKNPESIEPRVRRAEATQKN